MDPWTGLNNYLIFNDEDWISSDTFILFPERITSLVCDYGDGDEYIEEGGENGEGGENSTEAIVSDIVDEAKGTTNDENKPTKIGEEEEAETKKPKI